MVAEAVAVADQVQAQAVLEVLVVVELVVAEKVQHQI
jgi:hypothetical protein